MTASKVMVFGGTSLVGRYLLKHLVAAKHPVVAVTRRATHYERERDGVRWIHADLSEPGVVDSLPRADTAISLLSIWMTADLAPELSERGLQRLVAFSSTSAETKMTASDAGERALCVRLQDGERRVRALAPTTSTILRPTMIYGGRGDRNVERIAYHLRRFHVFPLVNGGVGLRQPVHAEDLATAAIDVMRTPETGGGTYTVAGGEQLSVRELVTRVGEVTGHRPYFLNVPLRPTQRLLESVTKLPGVRAVPTGSLERMTMDMVFDNSPATSAFGYSPRSFVPPVYDAASPAGGDTASMNQGTVK